MVSEYLSAKPNERSAYSVRALLPYFKLKQVHTIGKIDIQRFVRARQSNGITDGTIRRDLGVLRAAMNYARDQLGWSVSTFPAASLPKKPPGRVRWLTRQEYSRLLSVAAKHKRAPHLALFIHLAVNTGMRKGELLGLEWSRIDFQRREAYLSPEHQKNRQYNTVPLNDASISALNTLRNDTKWVFQRNGVRIKSIKTSFSAACREAEIHDFRVHDLRHTCAAWLVQAGHSLPVVGQVLRHQDVASTAIYAHLAPESAKAAVNSL